MAYATDLRRIAMNLEGTIEVRHFDRAAFKVNRIYATLPPDGLTANLNLTPEEQDFKVMMAPDGFAPVPNAWGRKGWTTVTLAAVEEAELRATLEMAWRHALPKRTPKR